MHIREGPRPTTATPLKITPCTQEVTHYRLTPKGAAPLQSCALPGAKKKPPLAAAKPRPPLLCGEPVGRSFARSLPRPALSTKGRRDGAGGVSRPRFVNYSSVQFTKRGATSGFSGSDIDQFCVLCGTHRRQFRRYGQKLLLREWQWLPARLRVSS